SHGAHAGAGPDAHAGAFAEVLGEVPRAAAQSARAARRNALGQAGRARRESEGREAAEAGAARPEVAQARDQGRQGRHRARPGRGRRRRGADLAVRVTRAVVVVNPAAGGGRTARIWRRLRDVMAATLPAEHAETRGPGDGERLAREAAASGAALVVAVGGDGTLNEVVNGVRTAGRGTPGGAVLTGRGCDASRNFGVPRDPIAAVRALAAGRDRQFDLGRPERGDGRRRCVTISAAAAFAT